MSHLRVHEETLIHFFSSYSQVTSQVTLIEIKLFFPNKYN